MKAHLFVLAAAYSLSACGLSDDDSAVFEQPTNGVESVQFVTLNRPSPSEHVIGEGEDTVTLNPYDYGQGMFVRNGGHAGFFTSSEGAGFVVNTLGENYEVAAALLRHRSDDPDLDTFYTGLSGTSTLIPTSGSATYDGDWGLVERTRFGFGSQSGDLTVDVSFADSTITGTGVNGSGGTVLEIVGTTAANGTFEGTVAYAGDTFDTVEGAFFGDTAEELAGTFTGNSMTGVIAAARNDTE